MPSKLKPVKDWEGPQTPEWWAGRIRQRWDGGGQKARDVLCLEIATQCQLATREDKIIVTYYGEVEPDVRAHPLDRKRVVFVDGEEEAALFMQWKGVRIYTTDWKGCVSENWFSTVRGLGEDDTLVPQFDIGDLDTPPVEDRKRLRKVFGRDDKKIKIAYAIEQGKICLDALV
jgi:hypothetical protein